MQQSNPSLKYEAKTDTEEDRIEEVKIGAIQDVDRRSHRPTNIHESRSQPSGTAEDLPKTHDPKRTDRSNKRNPSDRPGRPLMRKLQGIERPTAGLIDRSHISRLGEGRDDLALRARIIRLRKISSADVNTRYMK